MNPENSEQVPTPNRSRTLATFATPIAIVFGFALIAAAIFFSGGGSNPLPTTVGENNAPTPTGEIRPVDETDHIRGNPNAPVVFVEYSDYDCPFCKQFHDTMNRIITEYGPDGRVAWVYRHFPLEQLHPNAPLVAHASECVADLAGNDAFWEFSDLIFGERGTNEPTPITNLPDYAETVGVDRAAFTSCMDEQRFVAEVEADLNDGINAGAQGTPYTLVIVGDQQGVINGAQPYDVVKQITDNLLAQIDGQ